MSDSQINFSLLARRYASSLLEVALEEKKVSDVEKNITQLKNILDTNDALQAFIKDPCHNKKTQFDVMGAVLKKAKIKGLVEGLVSALITNGRLHALVDVCRVFYALYAEERGDLTAFVECAHAMSAAQKKRLQEVLTKRFERTISLNEKINPSLLGGIIVRVGSYMIDTSLLHQLHSLKMSMKEVG